MVIRFLKPELLRDRTNQMVLANSSREISKTMKPQILMDRPSVALNQAAEPVRKTMSYTSLLNMFLNFFIQVGLSEFLHAVSTVNIIAFMAMLNLNYPSNVQLIMGTILSLINMDVIEPQLTYSIMFEFDQALDYVEETMEKGLD